MGYSLSEDIEYAETRLTFLRALKDKYPDVNQVEVGDQTIYMSATAVKDVTDVDVFETSKGQSVLIPYVDFDGGRVYGAHIYHWAPVWKVLGTIRKEHSDTYQLIVQLASKG